MLPLFPLSLVAYPKEKLNLHIFEPRYRQLVNECLQEKTTFGIPPFIDNQVQSYGTEMRIVSLEKEYEDGRMDIRTEGLRVFRLQEFVNPVEGKLYAGGVVDYLTSDDDDLPVELTTSLLNKLAKLYSLLQLKLDIEVKRVRYLSFDVAHKIGLSLEQEYELLIIPTESERIGYLLNHLDRVLPIVADMERTKERVRMNGHFKNFDPLNF